MAGRPIALSERDLHTMVAVVEGTDADTRGAEDGTDGEARLPWPVLHGIRELLGCDELTCHDLEPAYRRVSFHQSTNTGSDELEVPDPSVSDPPEHPFWQHYWDGPCSYPDRTGDLRSVTTPYDFLSERQWVATSLFQDYFRPYGTKHSILLTLPDRPGRTIRLVAFRDSGSPFGERERAVLTLLRPHLYAAYLRRERHRHGVPDLTERQWQLLQLVALGHTNARIARQLGVSEGTVRKHMENIHSRLGVTSRAAALARAFPDRFAVA